MEDFKRSQISVGIRKAIFQGQPIKRPNLNWAGFADAKPSESIQKHDLPGLAVTALFPIKRGEEILTVPIKQFKDENSIQKKIRAAEKLAEWLLDQRKEELKILGFCLTQTQTMAANYGLSLIEELPGVHVEPHKARQRCHNMFSSQKLYNPTVRLKKRVGLARELNMKLNIGIIFLLLFVPAFASADTAECEIEIEDINANIAQKKVTKIKKLETFAFESGANALTATQRKNFKLPGEQYFCVLAFVDLQTDTSLSCESIKDQGYTYFQSEQGGNTGASSKIFLTFRHAISHFTISAICK